MTRIILVGCFGRMGKVVRSVVENSPDTEIVAGVDTATVGDGFTFPSFTEVTHCDMPADVVLDFTGDIELPGLLEYGEKKKIPLVICTTGFTLDMQEKIRGAAKKNAVFMSANMSLGINLITHILGKASKLLYNAGFDIEIIEKHHNKKLDAPSGTAYMLAESVNRALDGALTYVHDRSKTREKRKRDELGIHALRGGSIVGEHSVVFAGQDEMLEINHAAHSRDVFAVGAVKAAQFIKGKPPGLYSMQDLINEL